MKIIFNKSSLFILTFLLFNSCKHNVQEDRPDSSAERNKRKEAFIRVNRYVIARNEDLIDRFVERTGWNMKKTDTGLRYEIYSTGHGTPAETGNIIRYSYTARLLDGTFCDSVPADTPSTIKIGQGGVASGLEEAFLLLREGDRARLIIPPHLGQGNSGDGGKYPPGAIILYDVLLNRVEN